MKIILKNHNCKYLNLKMKNKNESYMLILVYILKVFFSISTRL